MLPRARSVSRGGTTQQSGELELALCLSVTAAPIGTDGVGVTAAPSGSESGQQTWVPSSKIGRKRSRSVNV